MKRRGVFPQAADPLRQLPFRNFSFHRVLVALLPAAAAFSVLSGFLWQLLAADSAPAAAPQVHGPAAYMGVAILLSASRHTFASIPTEMFSLFKI